ncbi:MAG: ImmA/IrrE family metallo-endopeptidase, partial [Rhodobacteraceae bacterium]|nr:ImmA/IrrE family metallo-endopeptidase [Paracoccaceae bacterium]
FTLAHEIAHYLLHRQIIIEEGEWSENVLLRSGQPLNVEYEANRLASDLIIPTDLLKQVIAEYSEPITCEVIDELASRFGVSSAAMEIKLQLS